jgi:NAD(P)H-hydrate epimerase
MEMLVSTQAMEQVDAKAQSDYGIPNLVLMEQAGSKGWHAFSSYAVERNISMRNMVFVAGGGNNGGDALVMAREAFFSGYEHFTILLVGSHISHACSVHRTICAKLGFTMIEAENMEGMIAPEAAQLLAEADVIVDGIAGTGLRGLLGGTVAEIVKMINARQDQGACVLAVDIPSGCSDTMSIAGTRIIANVTVTMGLQKAAAYHPVCRMGWGTILRVNPSFPPALLKNSVAVATLSDHRDLHIHRFGEDVYKNKRGHLALFAGSSRFTGAARLAARGAFHSRCGLVTLCCDQEVASVAAAETPSIIVQALQHHDVINGTVLAKEYQAIAAGPGWGDTHQDQVLELCASGLPLVLDADAVKLFAQVVADHRLQSTAHGPLVLTPHPGELHTLLETLHMPLLAQETGPSGSPESFIDSLKRAAVALEAVIVYKSHVIWIVDGRNGGAIPIVVDGMNNALGVAGSGDVLTGIIGSLLAQGYDALQAAHLGVLIHQQSGAEAREADGWFDAETLIGHVGTVCRRAEES